MDQRGNSLIIGIVVGVLVISGLSGAYYFGTLKNKTQIQNSIVTSPTFPSEINKKCSDTTIPGYEPVKSAEFKANFKGDNNETVRIYAQIPTTQNGVQVGRGLPVITKIFSGSSDCLKEEFEFTGKENDRSGNELYDAKIIPNFWGDGRDVLMVINESTGYGSGFQAFMNLISFKNGSYQMVDGPTLGELSLYKFTGKNEIGNEILKANGVWEQDEAHFQEHRYKFERYEWDGKQYNKIQLGTTRNKYLSDQERYIDQIIQAEPQVLLPI